MSKVIRQVRARLGAKWSVVLFLLPIAIFGIARLGPRAGFVFALSVSICVATSVLIRVLAGKPWRLLNAGSIVTGMLLGLTLSADVPVYMILVGALVAELVGKIRIDRLASNPFNPAALGRAAIAVIELIDPPDYGALHVDGVSSASPLLVNAGGNTAPELWAIFVGNTPGAIGETSALLLGLSGLLLLAFVVVKREATVAMLVTIAALTVMLPATAEIYGHAPWVLDPVVYLLGGPAFLYAFFFATDPATTPNTRWGGVIFGVGAGALGVLGRLYTTIPGAEMWAILIMNLVSPGLDRLLSRGLDRRKAPGGAQRAGRTTFYDQDRSGEGIRDSLRCVGVEALVPRQMAPFEILRRICLERREDVIDRVELSGLTGCGGAHFPAVRKWKTARAATGPRMLIVNAQEGEPDSAKDRALMRKRPELIIAGAAIVAHLLEAEEVLVVCGPEEVLGSAGLRSAIEQLRPGCPDLARRFELITGPGLYVCGEETALIAFLEGERGEPRERPPHPAQSGLRGLPTVIHNAETLAWLPRLLDEDAPKLCDLPRLVTVSGDVHEPGVYAVPRDLSLLELVAHSGGMVDGGSPMAYAVGGPTGEILGRDRGDMTVAELPGTGTLRVLGAERCLVSEARRSTRFAAAETCGRCTPCRVGSAELDRLWSEVAGGRADAASLALIDELGQTMAETSACGLGRDAPKRVFSVLHSFPDAVSSHLNGHECESCKK